MLIFFIYYTEFNLDKLKLKEPEKTYELTNFISKFETRYLKHLFYVQFI